MFFNEFSDNYADFGALQIRPLAKGDHSLIWQWMQKDYAQFWGMQGQSLTHVSDFYRVFEGHVQKRAYIIELDGIASALVELYDPKIEGLDAHLALDENDIGMHILLAPNNTPKRHFSFQMMRFLLSAIFDHNTQARVVVEPDSRNHKIHTLNKRLGFVHTKKIMLGEKSAYLATCGVTQFKNAVATFLRLNTTATGDFMRQPELAQNHLHQAVWQAANRDLIVKAISEFCHERILTPTQNQSGLWQLDYAGGYYVFSADLLALESYVIAPASLQKYDDKGATVTLDAVTFILEFATQLGLEGLRLATYIEELQSTLSSSCYKRSNEKFSAKALVDADFQTLEGAMTEGHPAFIANNGRIGFTSLDYRNFAPETSHPIQLIWLAAHKNHTDFSHSPAFGDFNALMVNELDITTRDHFESLIRAQEQDPSDYYYLPVHPWQWHNKLNPIFASELAQKRLICLGLGDDYYLAQQSIRTFYNISHPDKNYVKVALSILNMGFMRGLSAGYMKVTPAINDWAYQLVKNDHTLNALGFTLLREHSTLGYTHHAFEHSHIGDTPYRKMLACLWRENPSNQINDNERLMTMAGLLHLDYQGNSLLGALMDKSGLSAESWLSQYMDAYLIPLVHCFYAHKLVFMPHGENLILALENHVPKRVFMKDIGEEVALLNRDIALPEQVERIKISMPKEMELLSIFTDVFDCIFRYMVAILHREQRLRESAFWQIVSERVLAYQAAHPELAERFAEYDFFTEEFGHSCLNRLQLGNNKQMVDLTDPASSLKFAGTLKNPVAPFKEGVSLGAKRARA